MSAMQLILIFFGVTKAMWTKEMETLAQVEDALKIYALDDYNMNGFGATSVEVETLRNGALIGGASTGDVTTNGSDSTEVANFTEEEDPDVNQANVTSNATSNATSPDPIQDSVRTASSETPAQLPNETASLSAQMGSCNGTLSVIQGTYEVKDYANNIDCTFKVPAKSITITNFDLQYYRDWLYVEFQNKDKKYQYRLSGKRYKLPVTISSPTGLFTLRWTTDFGSSPNTGFTFVANK